MTAFTPEITCGDLIIHTRARTTMLKGGYVALTAMEFDLVETLAVHENQVLSRQVLSVLLYSIHEQPNSNSIDVLVGRLRKKLKDSDVEIVTVRSKGFILRRTGASKE